MPSLSTSAASTIEPPRQLLPQSKKYNAPAPGVTPGVPRGVDFPLLYQFSEPAADVEFQIYRIRKQLQTDLTKNGAVLLRGFVHDEAAPQEFADVMTSMGWASYEYIGGAAPRTAVVGSGDKPIVFTTNESPPSEPIPFHHELGQVENPPSYICFFCERPALEGGETPVLYSPAVVDFVKREFSGVYEKLAAVGVK